MQTRPLVLLLGLGIGACESAVDRSASLDAPREALVEPAQDACAPPAMPPDGATDAPQASDFAACASDDECIAVNRVGCCNNGRKEAVSRAGAGAYAASFKCPIAHPICLQYLIVDQRTPACDARTSTCVLVPPPDP